MRPQLSWRPLRDAGVVATLLLAAVWLGSRGGRDLDPALFGYLAATVVAAIATTWRASAFWRRQPSAIYGRAIANALRDPRRFSMLIRAASSDLGAQRFLARRSRVRWLAHLMLSLGTLASFAITVPLVFGWVRFVAEDQDHYRPVVLGVALGRFVLDGTAAFLVFHALALAAVAVTLGATYFLAVRLRARTLPGATERAQTWPLLLLLFVALSGLALPASRTNAVLFAVASVVHELAVVVLLIALPFSKLGHVFIRPLQLGVRLMHARNATRATCVVCAAVLAPTAQLAAVETLLAAHGARFADYQRHCPGCRRRLVIATHAQLIGPRFQPEIAETRPYAAGEAA